MNKSNSPLSEDKTMLHNSLSPADEVSIKQNGCIYGNDIKLQSETQEKTNYYESNNENPCNSDNYQKSSHAHVVKQKGKKNFRFLKWIILIVVMIFVFLIGFFIGEFVASDNWEKIYYPLNNDYNNLVYKYNILVDEYNSEFVQKQEFEEFETLYFAGIGNDTIKGLKAPSGSYYITCKHQGNSNCFAYFYNSIDASYGDLIANFIGEGSEIYGYSGIIDNGYINIQADGSWSITIEKAE